MSLSAFLTTSIATSVTGGTFLSLGIILGTFFLEDSTTIIVGMLAADHVLPISHALLSLYAGVILGDLAIYLLGRLASTHPKLAHYVDHDFIAPFRVWLETRFVLTVFSARFIPGARLPTYAASGFFRSPLSVFMLTAIGATSLWTTVLFFLSYWFGNITTEWMGSVRWSIALLFIIALFLVGRHNIRSYNAKRAALRTADDTHTT